MLELENEIWFGYNVKKTENRTFDDYMNTYLNKESKCMLQNIDLSLYLTISKDSNCPYKFKVGEWVLTTGSCHTPEGVKIYPPFKNFQDAIDYAQDYLEINHFLQPPK